MKGTAKKADASARPSLKDSGIRYRRLFEAAQDGILILDAKTGAITDVNPFLINLLGYSRGELVDKKLWEVGAFRDVEASREAFQVLQHDKYIRYTDLPLKTKDGKLIPVEFISNVYTAGGEKVILCNVRDITNRKQAEELLRESDKRFRALIENSSDAITLLDAGGRALYDSPAAPGMLGYGPEDWIGKQVFGLLHPDDLAEIQELFQELAEKPGKRAAGIFRVRHKNGSWLWIEAVATNLLAEPAVRAIVLNYRDITARKQSEQLVRDSEERFRTMIDQAPFAIAVLDTQGRPIIANLRLSEMVGYSKAELSKMNFTDITHPEDAALDMKQFIDVVEGRISSYTMEKRYIHRNGSLIWANLHVAVVRGEDGTPQHILGMSEDITARKQAETALRQSEENYRLLVQNLPDGVVVDMDGLVVFANLASAKIIGAASPADLSGKPVLEFVHPDYREPARKRVQRSLAEGVAAPAAEEKFVRLDGTPIDTEVLGIPFQYAGKPALLTVFTDITARKRAQARIQQQLAHLMALSAIDRVISSNFDLRLSLPEILAQVTKGLGVDAADVLILNSTAQTLEYGAERGFRMQAVRKTQVRLGENYAGRIAMDRQPIHIPILRNEPDHLLLTTLLAGEDFVCYYGLPLIAKGRVNGVLEVFHRSALAPDPEWLDFLSALAEQVAIAIENATLFESLQRSNTQLALAYDATIEGWSHALDLRDKETQGHTQRVTEMTVKLARDFGLSDAELVQVRWGALLHDIGKMGVPDSILLKPGPLTEEEWVAMRKHPGFAYEMLSPIHYLRLALDIPYGHHENWDGTGYPRGLKGDQIPLVARIFAVVDVWDALGSDRPYRPAWPAGKVLEHIRAGSGTHFDPQVVNVFLQILG